MYKSTLICLLIFLINHAILSQTQSNVELASSIQSKYKKSPLFITNEVLNLKFEKNYSLKNVYISTQRKTNYLSLRINEKVNLYEYYSNFSEVKNFTAKSSLKQQKKDADKYCGTYTREGIFYDDSKFCSQTLDLKELGEEWEVESNMYYKEAKYYSSLYFNEIYPLEKRTVNITFHKDIKLEIKEFNFDGYTISKTEKQNGDLTTISFIAEKLSPFENEYLERGSQFTYPHILFIVKSVTLNNTNNYSLLSNIDDMYLWNSSLIKQLKPNLSILKPQVDKLIEKCKSDQEKIEAVYYWVQDNIRYIAFEDGLAGYKPAEAHDVFEKKFGDCKGMANLLKEMLTLAGIDARLAWIGTNNLKHDFPTPNMSINNHMICAIKFNNRFVFLDGTEKQSKFLDYAERLQGRKVMFEDGSKYILDSIPTSPSSANLKATYSSLKIIDNKIIATSSSTLCGETNRDVLNLYHNASNGKKETEVKEYLGENTNFTINQINLTQLSRSNNSVLNYSCTANNAVNLFDKELYVMMNLLKTPRIIKTEPNRISDLYFGEKIFEITTNELEIPSGYSVTSIPKNIEIKTDYYGFSINYSTNNNKIICTKTIVTNTTTVPKKHFEKWNSDIKLLNKSQQEQVVLTKI